MCTVEIGMAVIASRAKPALMRSGRLADESYGATAQPDWRDIDWRQHLRELDIDGGRVNYVDIGSGEGPPIVFVHGLGGAWQNWLENIPRAALERRVLALDLPGFGQSEMPLEPISIPGYGRLVDKFCERLGLGEVVLVGNSMGGFITAEVAIQHPQRVERLVLVSAAGISITTMRRRPVQTWGRAAAAIGAYGAAHLRATVVRPRLRHLALGYVVRHPTRLRADLCWELMRGAGRPGFLDALNALLDYDFQDRLGDIRAQTLIVWGSNDMLVPVKDASEFERLIPNSRKVIMEDTGHVSMIERPETFNRLLMEFIAEEQPAARSDETEAAA
jgi:pimeloyl-ACP methyl ester carboxylesterase